jgi:hypothetical protein
MSLDVATHYLAVSTPVESNYFASSADIWEISTFGIWGKEVSHQFNLANPASPAAVAQVFPAPRMHLKKP